MPWRNGGGTTTELAVQPASAGLAGASFGYRVSIADVTVSGPFSRFAGCDRHIMMLSGAGMTLDCGTHGSVVLDAPFQPRAFSGDWEVEGVLAAGPVRDFNLIVDRAWASSSLDARLLERRDVMTLEAGATCLVHVIDGELVQGAAGDTIVTSDAQLELEPRGRARIAIARVVPRQR